jgi:beta-phosphoglucomutase-like phosphatase (HAD superfamily)
VVENAPLGVQASVAAGIFTIAVNTGPIDGQVLLDAGANLLFPSMPNFCDAWHGLFEAIRQTQQDSIALSK